MNSQKLPLKWRILYSFLESSQCLKLLKVSGSSPSELMQLHERSGQNQNNNELKILAEGSAKTNFHTVCRKQSETMRRLYFI